MKLCTTLCLVRRKVDAGPGSNLLWPEVELPELLPENWVSISILLRFQFISAREVLIERMTRVVEDDYQDDADGVCLDVCAHRGREKVQPTNEPPIQCNAEYIEIQYNTKHLQSKAKHNTTMQWMSLHCSRPFPLPSFDEPWLQLNFDFHTRSPLVKGGKEEKLECEIAWDLRFADWARRYEPSASECKSQCKGGTRVQVDKIRCLIHLGTLLADFTTILAGDNRFPKVTRGFQQTFTPSSFPQVIQSNTIQYNTIQYNTIQYNTIQRFLLLSSQTIQYNTPSFPQVIRPRLSGPLHIRGRISHQANPYPQVTCYSTLRFANDLVSGIVVLSPSYLSQ